MRMYFGIRWFMVHQYGGCDHVRNVMMCIYVSCNGSIGTCFIATCSSSVHLHYMYSLACHTPQSQGKRGLVIMRTTSCSGDQIWLRPIGFEIWIYCQATPCLQRARVWPAMLFLRLSVTSFAIIAFHENDSLYAWSPDPSFLICDWGVWRARLHYMIWWGYKSDSEI